jgi:hypothetical protein
MRVTFIATPPPPLPLPTHQIDDPFSEMKIGVIARTVFRNIHKSGKVHKDEIENAGRGILKENI